MIFRRLAQNLLEQNWTTIAIEFVLLVCGVFLGIQAANWNETRRDHAREAEFLARLERDFVAIDARLDDNIAKWQAYSAAPRRVLADLAVFREQGIWPRGKQETLADLNEVFNGRVPAPRAATYVELLSAGQLELIRNVTLRDALLQYDMQVGYSQTAFNILIQRSLPHMASLVTHLEFDLDIDDAELPSTPPVRDVWADVDLQGLAADPASTLALKMYASVSENQLRAARLQQEKAVAVLTLLGTGAVRAASEQP
jgi:hypothetical protein